MMHPSQNPEAPIVVDDASQEKIHVPHMGRETAYGQHGQGQKYPDAVGTEAGVGTGNVEPPRPKTCGVPRKAFWIMLAIVLVLIAAAIGGGVGGYCAGKSKNASKDLSESGDGTAISVLTSTTSLPGAAAPTVITTTIPLNSGGGPTKAGSTTLATATGASPANCAVQPARSNDVNVTCPGADQCLYTVPGSSHRFQRLCGMRLSGEAVEVVKVSSMADCLKKCVDYNARNRPGVCVGVTWMYGGTEAEHRNCYVQSRVGGIYDKDSTEGAVLLEY